MILASSHAKRDLATQVPSPCIWTENSILSSYRIAMLVLAKKWLAGTLYAMHGWGIATRCAH